MITGDALGRRGNRRDLFARQRDERMLVRSRCVTVRANSSRSTASAAPAGTRATSAACITSEPAGASPLSAGRPRCRACRRGTSCCTPARRGGPSCGRRWAAAGRISWRVTGTPRDGGLPGGLAAGQAAADDADHGPIGRCRIAKSAYAGIRLSSSGASRTYVRSPRCCRSAGARPSW